MGAEPTEKQLIEEALAVARNATNEIALRVDALTALRYLVEPIDNAMGRVFALFPPRSFIVRNLAFRIRRGASLLKSSAQT